MSLRTPACQGTTDKHCEICIHGQMIWICCECGDALTPWHPDIQGLVIDGLVVV